MKAFKPQGGGNFEPTPAGNHLVVCTRHIDLGTQHVPAGKYPAKNIHQVVLGWELPNQRINYTDKDGNPAEGPVIHYQTFNFSFHENSNLRKVLENWRGLPFRDEELEPGPKQFDTKNLIGVPAQILIMHDAVGDKTYANMKAIMPASIPKQNWPKPEGEIVYYDIDDHSPKMFDKLSDFWKEKIMTSPEYIETVGNKISDREWV